MQTTDSFIFTLWEKYALPSKKRVHVTLVARVADFLAHRLMDTSPDIHIDLSVLRTASLLHDIDSGVQFLPHESHPDAAVRILRVEGLLQEANIVKTHSLYAVLDAGIMPKKWEEKVLYLSDKMVKYEIITVEKRFALWRKEQLPRGAIEKMNLCYPIVKKLEDEIFSRIHTDPRRVAEYLS